MDKTTTIIYLLAKAVPHISPAICKILDVAIRESKTRAKVTGNPWDDVAVSLLASLFSVDL